MTKEIAIVGAGGLGREVLALINALPEWKVVGFFDDGLKKGAKVDYYEVLGNKEDLFRWPETISVVIAIGDPMIKKQVHEYLSQCTHLTYPSLIHPRALIMDDSCVIGDGSVLAAACILTTHVQVGNHVLINLNATIGHDSVLGNYSSIMPGVNLAGAVAIGEAVLIGSGANVLGGLTIGSGSVIGSGAVVNRNVGRDVTAVGVPARVIKHK